jgi:superfamily II DNA or RNA helicase
MVVDEHEDVLAPPEPGQIVRVRSRHWTVGDVERSTLAREVAGLRRAQHLVTLRAFDEDAAPDETLRVIWEIEIDARVVDRGELPRAEHFDDPTIFDAFLDAVRWGATARIDTERSLELLAPFRSGIDIDSYQLEPVARALRMPRVALLIADDVGLGKTIEAGLVAQELALRYRARRMLILAPADLVVQWQDEMRTKFGLRFDVVNREYIKALRRERGPYVNPFEASNRIIVSYDWLKDERWLRRFRETLPGPHESQFPRRWDLLILDEAHNVAPSGRGRYAKETLRTRMVREIAPQCEHRLFLTATPHNGYDESFSGLLEILDESRFARAVVPSPDELSAVMVRRMKTDIPPAADGTPRFPTRRVEAIPFEPSKDEVAAYDVLSEYVALLQRESSSAQSTAADFVGILLKKRFLSSPAAFLATVRQHRASRSAVKKVTSVDQRLLRDRIDELDNGFETDAEAEDATADADAVASRGLPLLSPDADELLGRLEEFAELATGRPDSRAAALIELIERELRPGGNWGQERLIVFTEYRATQMWLFELLAARGLTKGNRVSCLFGGMPRDEREAIKHEFQAPLDKSPVRILLATDAASEGINLQNHCAWIVHMEIPWNPNRLEQRNGRVDRRGQARPEVLIQHFAPRALTDASGSVSTTLDVDIRILTKAVEKIERIRTRLGTAGTVLSEQIQDAILGKRKELDTLPEEVGDPVEGIIRRERDLSAKLADLVAQLDEYRRELHLDDPDHVRRAVDAALGLAGQPLLIAGESGGTWVVGELTGAWAQAKVDLAEPFPADPENPRQRPVVFDQSLEAGGTNVYCHLEHPLVAMSLRKLRAEVWSPERSESGAKLQRVTARYVLAGGIEEPVVVAHARLVVTGGSGHKLHEELISAAGRLCGDKLERLNVGETTAALSALDDGVVSPDVRAWLLDQQERLEGKVLEAVIARGRDRSEQVVRTTERRGKEEASRIDSLFDELRRGIESALSAQEPDQLALWSDDEKRMRDLDRRYLEHRLEVLPSQAEAERQAVMRRFAAPEWRVVPVAIEFRVPVGWMP